MSRLSERGLAVIRASSAARACAGRTGRLALVVALALWGPAAAAQRCNKLAATDLVFTGYTPFGGGVVATTEITYLCPTPVTQASLSISAPRVMTAGGASLQFELYADAGLLDPWPTGSARAVTPSKDGSITLWGYLPPQDAAAGSYVGSLTVTLQTPHQSDTTTLAASSDVAHACVVDPGTIAFGTYAADAARDGTGALSIACTRGTTYSVALGPGNHSAGGRQMASGAARLRYDLFSDPGRSTPWDPATPVSGAAPSTARVALPVYGRIPAGQSVPPGAYSDTVQSTINF